VREWHCWAKPPWVTLFWGVVFAFQLALVIGGKPLLLHMRQLLLPFLPHAQ
jgi:hypothetical protein